MKLTDIPRAVFDEAATRAVTAARLANLELPYDPQGAPFHLLVVAPPTDEDLPNLVLEEEISEKERKELIARYVAEVHSHIRDTILGEHVDPGAERTIEKLGLSLLEIAPLKIATCTLNAGLDLREVITGPGVGVGDVISFGAMHLLWRDPDGVVHHMFGAGTGWNPVINRQAVQLFLGMFDLVLAEERLWQPFSMSGPFVVLQSEGLERVPVQPPHPENYRPPLAAA